MRRYSSITCLKQALCGSQELIALDMCLVIDTGSFYIFAFQRVCYNGLLMQAVALYR